MGSLTNLYNYFLTLFISFLLPILCFSNHINGVISNKNGEPLPFASVYIKNTTYGVSSNAFGEYFIELKPGTYTIVYSYIGYQSKEKTRLTTETGPHPCCQTRISPIKPSWKRRKEKAQQKQRQEKQEVIKYSISH